MDAAPRGPCSSRQADLCVFSRAEHQAAWNCLQEELEPHPLTEAKFSASWGLFSMPSGDTAVHLLSSAPVRACKWGALFGAEFQARASHPGRAHPHPSSSPVRMSRELKKAMRGNLRSWCSMKTRTGMMLGSHRWLMNRLMLP